MIDIPTVAATTIVQAIALYIFNRFFMKRDERIEKLETKLEIVDAQKVEQLNTGIREGKESRARIHQEIDTMNKTIAIHGEAITRVQEHLYEFKDGVKKLERVATQVEAASNRIEEVALQQFGLARELSAVSERVKDLRKQT